MMKSTKPMENITLYLNTKPPGFDTGKSGTSPGTITYNNFQKTTISRTYIGGGATKKDHKVSCTWNISPIVLNEYSIMKLSCVAHQSDDHSADHGSTNPSLITIRISDLQINPELYRSTDNTLPIIFAGSFGSEASFTDVSSGGLHLNPQTINRITLYFSDLIDDPYAGTDDTMDYIIGITITPYDRSFSATEN